MRLACVLSVLLLAGCPALQQLAGSGGLRPPDPPRIVVAGVGLAHHPDPITIARALCPQVAPALVCMAIGGMPSAAELRIGFALQLDVTNVATIPLPLVEALVAFTAYPGQQGANNLGAVCLSFCDAGAACPARPDACSGGGPQIRTAQDFAMASAGFLIAMAAGQASPDNLKIRTLAPNQTTRVTVGLELDPIQVVGLIAKFATASTDAIKRGNTPRFEIPYAVEGTAWVTVESFGRIAAGFGPVQGAWQIQ
jgi:hypothetical protein